MPLRRPLALLALLALAACGDDSGGSPIDPVDPAESFPVALPVLGQGALSARYSAELSVRGDYAYTTTWGIRGANNRGNTLYVWDVRGAQPALLDSVRVETATTLGDVEVSDDGELLVVAQEQNPAGAVLLFDLADPRRPTLITRYATEATRTGVHTAEVERVGGRQHVFLSVNPSFATDEPVRSKLLVLDVEDPAAPQLVLSREMGDPNVHDVFVRDGLLFTANWDEGIAIWDIGAQGASLASPRLLSTLRTMGGNVHNAWWYHDASGSRRYLFVGEEQGGFGAGSAGDVHVVDVSDPALPREVAFFSVAGAGTHNFWVDEQRGILYAAYYNGGVRALDVRGDLGGCNPAQRGDAGPAALLCDLGKMGREVGRGLADRPVYVWGVQAVGEVLYASDMHNGLWKLDLAPLHRALGR